MITAWYCFATFSARRFYPTPFEASTDWLPAVSLLCLRHLSCQRLKTHKRAVLDCNLQNRVRKAKTRTIFVRFPRRCKGGPDSIC